MNDNYLLWLVWWGLDKNVLIRTFEDRAEAEAACNKLNTQCNTGEVALCMFMVTRECGLE